MSTGLVIHLVLCVLGTVAGAFLAMGSFISIANMKNVPWVGTLLLAAAAIPLLWLGSGVSAWLFHSSKNAAWFKILLIFPWVYTAAFIGVMLSLFKSQ